MGGWRRGGGWDDRPALDVANSKVMGSKLAPETSDKRHEERCGVAPRGEGGRYGGWLRWMGSPERATDAWPLSDDVHWIAAILDFMEWIHCGYS